MGVTWGVTFGSSRTRGKMNAGSNNYTTGTGKMATDEGIVKGIEIDLTLGQEEVFARRSSIAHSPPSGTASPITPVAKMSHQATNVIEAQTSPARHSRLNVFSQMKRCNSYDSGKKRKKMDSSLDLDQEVEIRREAGDPMIFVLVEALELISTCSKDLDVKISEHPNTKREIKEIACKLKRGVEVINRRAVKDLLEALKVAQLGTTKYDIDTQTEDSKQLTSKGEGRTISTQTEMDETLGGTLAPRPVEARRGPVRAEEIAEAKDFLGYSRIANRPWEEGSFNRTRCATGPHLGASSDVDLAVWVEEDGREMKRSIQGMFRSRFPELPIMEGRVSVLVNTTAINVEGETKINRRYVYKLDGAGSEAQCFETLIELREVVVKGGRGKTQAK